MEMNMATLHVRSVPDDLYEQIRELARGGGRSLSAQVVALLEEAVQGQETRRRQGEILARIRRRRLVPPATARGSLDLLREDRAR